MADGVMMELNGVRKRVPADRVDYFAAKGAKPVQDAAAAAPTPAAPAEQPSLPERALKKFTDFNEGAAQGFLKQASMGLDDEVARLSARLGGTIQRQSDADDAMLSGGGESILDSWRATQGLGQEAADERRQEVERAADRAPIAYGAGSLAGLGTAVAGGPGGAKTALGRLGQGAAFGGVGGAGMSDADSLAEAAPDAALGAGLGGLLGAAGPAVGRFAKGVKDTLAPGLRKAVGDVPGGMRAAGDRLEDLVTKTASDQPLVQMVTAGPRATAGVVGKTLKGLAGPAPVPEATAGLAPVVDDEVAAQMLARLKGSPAAAPKAAPEATASLPPQMEKEGFAEILARLKGEGAPAAPKAPAPAAPLPSSAPPVPPPQAAPAKPPVSFLPAVDDVSTVGPAQIRAANESMTPMNVRRSVLGRRPTNDEMDAAVEMAAQEVGPDVASIVNKTGLPTREVSERLTRRLRAADFRQRLPDAEGRVARETAQSPVDNVSGRASKQVQAIGQQEGWSRAYQALPPEKRAAYIQQLKQETGLPDDVIRRRLKLTLAEWRRTSFERGGAEPPVLTKKKVIDEPNASGGEGESEALTDMEISLARRNVDDAFDALDDASRASAKNLVESGVPKPAATKVASAIKRIGRCGDSAAMSGKCMTISRDLAKDLDGMRYIDDYGDTQEVKAFATQLWDVPDSIKGNPLADGHYVVKAVIDNETFWIDLTAAQFGAKGPMATAGNRVPTILDDFSEF